jgi:hypothetical protein
MSKIRLFLLFFCILSVVVSSGANLPSAQSAPAQQTRSEPMSLFGLNLYITGRERNDQQARELVAKSQQIGVDWTREEISWASWGSNPDNSFFDKRIRMLSDGGIKIIGMLLTTPEKLRSRDCVRHAKANNEPEYWCAPTDPVAYGNWVKMVVERYDGDGVNDAPGSPRVDAWEIWNEPDIDGTWLPKADPAAYAAILRAGYDAVKSADPSALVLNGGVMTFDSIGVDAFMDKVVAIAGWDSFDVLSLHPWLIDHAPDAPYLKNPRENYDVTLPGRFEMAKRWVERHGGGKPIWVTEVGWSTCGNRCEPQFAKNEDEQATYMLRTFVLAAASGIEHVNYFQLEDKFDGGQQPWGPAAILNNNLTPKLAYTAYGVMTAQLRGARYAGTGPLHSAGQIGDYRFTLADGGSVRVIWRISGSQQVQVALNEGSSAALIERDGQRTQLGGGSASITISEKPVYLRQSNNEQYFPETNHLVSGAFLNYWRNNGATEIIGLPISAARYERGSDGGRYLVQYFERARFEYHPEKSPAYQVLLGLLGVTLLEQRGIDWRTLPSVDGAGDGCRYFPETRHSLCAEFRDYWERHGGVAVFGLPISEPLDEVSADDGKVYRVQYFERNRFEYHPENPAPYQVQLGRLGAELMP